MPVHACGAHRGYFAQTMRHYGSQSWCLTTSEVQVTDLRLSSEQRGGAVVVAVGGELDLITSRELDEQLTRARRESSRIVLDLAGVEFMDTSSLAVIVGHWKRLQ